MIISMMGVTSCFSSMAITGGQLQGRRVNVFRSRTISDDVGVRQGYLLGSALNSFGV